MPKKSEQMTYGDSVALDIIHYIDTMYPAMWDGVPKSARQSIKNVIKREVDCVLNLYARE